MRLLPESERLEMLETLQKSCLDVEKQLATLPFRIETPSQVCTAIHILDFATGSPVELALELCHTIPPVNLAKHDRIKLCLQIRHKAGLDRRMAEIEEAIKLFSQKKVLIQVRIAFPLIELRGHHAFAELGMNAGIEYMPFNGGRLCFTSCTNRHPSHDQLGRSWHIVSSSRAGLQNHTSSSDKTRGLYLDSLNDISPIMMHCRCGRPLLCSLLVCTFQTWMGMINAACSMLMSRI